MKTAQKIHFYGNSGLSVHRGRLHIYEKSLHALKLRTVGRAVRQRKFKSVGIRQNAVFALPCVVND